MAKLAIPFVFIDESVVDYGFRVLMSGYQGEQFEKNPVLLLQHKRMGDGYDAMTDDTVLPLGKWYEIGVVGQQLIAKPEFDDDDPFALKVQGKVEKGYLNAASIWIDPIEVSDDENLKLPGQYGPTLTKWGIRESSIVDIPNCRNSLAIRTAANHKILMNGETENTAAVVDYLKTLLPNKSDIMDKKLLCEKLGIDENASEKVIANKLAALTSSETKLTALTTENKDLKDQLVEIKTAAETAKHESLVDSAIAGKKLAAGDREKYLKLAKADYDTTKELIDGMKAYESVEAKLSGSGTGGGDHSAEVGELMKLSGQTLYDQDKLDRLKAIASPEQFKLKYKEAFGVDFKG